MATVLYRLGSWTFDHRRAVLAIWVAVLVALGALAAALGGKVSDTFTVPGTESQRALNLLNREFPGTGGATARIVFAAPPGHTLIEPQYGRSSYRRSPRPAGSADGRWLGGVPAERRALPRQTDRLRRRPVHGSGGQDLQLDQGGARPGGRAGAARPGSKSSSPAAWSRPTRAARDSGTSSAWPSRSSSCRSCSGGGCRRRCRWSPR